VGYGSIQNEPKEFTCGIFIYYSVDISLAGEGNMVEDDMISSEKLDVVQPVSVGLRSLAASFPVFASAAALWNEYENRKFREHVEEFFKETTVKLEELGGRLIIQEDFVKSEEFIHLLLLIIDRVKLEHRSEKRKRFSDFFVKSMSDKVMPDFNEKRHFVYVLDDLNDYDFMLLNILRRGKMKVDQNVRNQDDLEKMIVSLRKLERWGLISTTSPADGMDGIGWAGDQRSWENAERDKWYELLPIGRRFVEYFEIDV